MQQTVLDQAQQLLSLTAAVAALSGQGAPAQTAPDVSKKEKKRIAAEAAAAAALAVNAPTAANGPNAIKPAITPAPAPALVLANPSAFDYKYDGPAWKDVLTHNRPRMLDGKTLQWPQPPDFKSSWVDVKGSNLCASGATQALVGITALLSAPLLSPRMFTFTRTAPTLCVGISGQ